MKIKFNLDDNLPLKKMLKLYSLIQVFRSVFQEGSEYYSQVFLNECLYKLQMLKYDRIDVPEGIGVNKTNESSRCIICNYYYFLKANFRFQPKA